MVWEEFRILATTGGPWALVSLPCDHGLLKGLWLYINDNHMSYSLNSLKGIMHRSL